MRIKKTITITLSVKNFMVKNTVSNDVLKWFGLDSSDFEGLDEIECEEKDLVICLDGSIYYGASDVDVDTTDKDFPESMYKQLDEIALDNEYWLY